MSDTAVGTIPTVTASLNYLDPDSKNFARFVAPGAEVNTAEYRSYDVDIRDGRAIAERFDIDVNGFELVSHASAMTDFTDREAIAALYTQEVEDFIKARFGATFVAPLGAVLRKTATPGAAKSQPQASDVHVDYAPETSSKRLGDLYAKVRPDGPGFTRAISTSFWRVFSAPPQDWPLTLCDAQSVGDDEGVAAPLIWSDAIPSDPLATLSTLDLSGYLAGSGFYHRPEHEWWYFSGMSRDEALLFKLHDTDHSVAWRCVHTAFRDPSVTTEIPRHSIEFRSVAFFE